MFITLHKKGNLRHCQTYRTIDLISHASKEMLEAKLNTLKPYSEEIFAEEQEDAGNGRPTAEQINLLVFCEKYLQDQQLLFHVFIYFDEAALWAKCITVRKLFHTRYILSQDMAFKRTSSNIAYQKRPSFRPHAYQLTRQHTLDCKKKSLFADVCRVLF